MDLTSHEIRKKFLAFFESKQHKIVASAPIVVKNDPTLMFTNAGMNQFKDLFLGNSPILFHRVADTQKCLRVSGKHNDLEEVGVDTYHHTMFEMVGNWSFGDPTNPTAGYFKKESICWGWELLTEVFQLDKSRIYVTVFEGDEQENLLKDEASFLEWEKYIPLNHILNGNKKDNFWEMGETGPCGPCTEIHYDMRNDEQRKLIDGKLLVNTGDPQVIEIWNHVFIQFNRNANGNLEELPAKHVDTGMGFERLVRALQNKSSNYDTDIFSPLINHIEKISGREYGLDIKTDIAMRVICDHIRAVSFCIADGQLPSNIGAGYVIRRILRRAIRYGFSFLDLKKPFFYQLVETLSHQFENVFNELFLQKDFVAKVIFEEETSFLKTLENGIKKINEVKIDLAKANKNCIDGNTTFELYDTFGFPIDLTKLIALELNLTVDEDGFEVEMQKQKKRSRNAAATETGDWQIIHDINKIEFVGYKNLSSKSQVVKMREIKIKNQIHFQIVLNKTPFYAESGGQIGDTGILEMKDELISVLDTKKENELIVHFTDKLPKNFNEEILAKVDIERRNQITLNHTATHLLHAALRNILGTHVQQKGSYVGPDRLRFDFSHFTKITDAELKQIEQLINKKTRENIPVLVKEMPIDEAKKIGAMMLFGEKYGDTVRVIVADETYSKEFCGGTHVGFTGEIGFCKIISETAVAAGIRRIEAITGVAVETYIENQEQILEKINTLTKGIDPIKNIEQLLQENENFKSEIEKFQSIQLNQLKQELKSKIKKHQNIQTILEIIPIQNAELMKKLAYELRNEVQNLFCVLGSETHSKANLLIIISDNLVKELNLNAALMIKELGKDIEGGGGGQPFFATAGGKKPEGLKIALEKALKYIL